MQTVAANDGQLGAGVAARILSQFLLLLGFLFLGFACAATFQSAMATDSNTATAPVQRIVIPLVATVTDTSQALIHTTQRTVSTLGQALAPAPAATAARPQTVLREAKATSVRHVQLTASSASQGAGRGVLDRTLTTVSNLVGAKVLPATAPLLNLATRPSSSLSTTLTATTSALEQTVARINALTSSALPIIQALVVPAPQAVSPGPAASQVIPVGGRATSGVALQLGEHQTATIGFEFRRLGPGVHLLAPRHITADPGSTHAAPALTPPDASAGALSLTTPVAPARSNGGHAAGSAVAGYPADHTTVRKPYEGSGVSGYTARVPRWLGAEPGHSPD